MYKLQARRSYLISLCLKFQTKTMIGLRTTIYHVSDLKEATEWYSNLFQTKPYFFNERYVGFNIAGYELGLQPQEDSTNKKSSVDSYWGVEDIKKEHAFFLENGAIVVDDIVDVGDGILMTTYKDPWGNMLGLIYNPNFKV